MRMIPAASALFALSACATTSQPVETEKPAATDATCRSDALSPFTGQIATAETGAKMLAAAGARALRWVPPRTAVTMDYRPDRLTVSYDDNMVIIRANCG